jgi:hypothetical protein
MEPHSDSEASLMYLPSEDDHDIKKEECPLPAAFCDVRVSYLCLYFYSLKKEFIYLVWENVLFDVIYTSISECNR